MSVFRILVVEIVPISDFGEVQVWASSLTLVYVAGCTGLFLLSVDVVSPDQVSFVTLVPVLTKTSWTCWCT